MSNVQRDVFLCHHMGDKPAVKELGYRLIRAGIQPWLDEWNLIPGEPWQEAIEEALAASATCAVFVGPSGLGPWQNEEMRAAIDRRVRAGQGSFRVIPVLLPGTERGERSKLPAFLSASTWVKFHDTLDDETAFHRLVSGIRGDEPGPGPEEPVYVDATPYRGLQVFDVDDWPFFFGREALVEWLLDELRPPTGTRPENRFLGIIGPSGSGKSSLARAGLASALKQGKIPGSERWPIAICRLGADPLESLAVELRRAIGGVQDTAALISLIAALRADKRALHLTVREALRDAPPERRLVMLVDQFEELFTLCDDDELRAAAIDALLYAATVTGGQTIVLLALRADFYGRCAAYSVLAAALSDHQMLVGPMTRDELWRAIERPALLAGCEFQPGLVATLLDDVKGQPGGLPLLQHALLELWNRRSGRVLTHAAYQEIGRVEGALERRAEAVYNGLGEAPDTSPSAEQVICQRIFLGLIQPGESTEDTKRRAPLQELLPSPGEQATVEAVLNILAAEDARLITIEGSAKDQFVELSHEALIRSWKRLRDWIDANRAALRIRRRLSEAADEWTLRRRDRHFLYQRAQLDEVARAIPESDLSPAERDFIRASRAAQRARRLWLVARIVGVVLLVAAVSVAGWLYESSTRWQQVAGFPQDRVWALAAGGGESPTYYAATADVGVVYSGDGVAWVEGREGLPTSDELADNDPRKNMRDTDILAVDAMDPRRVFTYVQDYGIYASTDAGASWQPMASPVLTDGAVLVEMAVHGQLMLALSDGSDDNRLYARMNSDQDWLEVGGGGVEPLQYAYTVVIAADGSTVYVGAESGFYSHPVESLGEGDWQPIAELSHVTIIEPGVGDAGLYLVAEADSGQSDIYRWKPEQSPERLESVPVPVIALAPNRGQGETLVYALLGNDEIWAVAAQSKTPFRGQPTGRANDLLAVVRPDRQGLWLLLANENGLWEYRRSLR